MLEDKAEKNMFLPKTKTCISNVLSLVSAPFFFFFFACFLIQRFSTVSEGICYHITVKTQVFYSFNMGLNELSKAENVEWGTTTVWIPL